jgi:hypothetical protein
MSRETQFLALTKALLGGATHIRKMMLGIAIVAVSAVPALAVCPAIPADCVAVDNPSIFELETNANAVSNGGTDWANETTKVFDHDAPNASTFTGGGSKDGLGINQWLQTNGSVPAKDDILDAFATAKIVGGQLLVYFGADRLANNGDANIGFWFFQNTVSAISTTGTAGFTGHHTDGDIFVVSGFTSGGTTANIAVYKWNCPGLSGLACDTGGSLSAPLFSGAAVTCVSSTPGGVHTVCASSNSTTQTAPWTFCPKGTPCGTFDVAEFFEGGVNLASLGVPTSTCFSSFLVETRSSTSVSAVLKDFTLGSFESCGITIAKSCVNGRLNAAGTAFLYDVYGTVTNIGSGTLNSVTITDTMPGAASTQSVNIGTVVGGATATWPGGAYNPSNNTTFFTFSTGTTNGPLNAAEVDADAGGGNIISGTTTAQCPTVATNPALTVTKVCSTDLTSNGNTLAVVVKFSGQACNTGNIPLNNVTVVDYVGTTATGTSNYTNNLGTLDAAGGANACRSFGGPTDTLAFYLPSLATVPTDDATNHGRYIFQDTVRATATPSIGTCGATANCVQDQTATCYLCENGQCRPAPVP